MLKGRVGVGVGVGVTHRTFISLHATLRPMCVCVCVCVCVCRSTMCTTA